MTLSEKNLDNSLVRFQSKSLPLTTSRLDQINPKPIEKSKHLPAVLSMLMIAAVAGCSGSDGVNDAAVFEDIISEEVSETDDALDPVEPSTLDLSLTVLIERFALDRAIETAHLPDISEPLPQLGMKLFYSKSLGGELDAACVSCHHPAFGGADALSLPIGVEAVAPDLLGPGRTNLAGVPLVPRNSPTVFNVGLWDTSLFWDSRVESIGKELASNGSISAIRTPDSDYLVADIDAGANLAASQARFPVTSVEEMKSDRFEGGSDNATIRDHLAARIGDYGVGEGELETNNWLVLFQEAFGVSSAAEELVTFDNIAHALGEFERSMVFIDSAWQRYMSGALEAISDDAKEGSLLFFTSVADGGAGCSACHNGPLFSDGGHHTVAFPQAGPGKGDGNNDDFGRERETGDEVHRYQFRTPSLLNIAQTAPYGHTGAYQTLHDVVRHYVNPNTALDDFFDRGGLCGTPQYQVVADCELLYPDNERNSSLALAKLNEERRAGLSLFQSPRLNNTQVNQLVAFMESLSDHCVADRECLNDWVPDPLETEPDGNQLNAVDEHGITL